MNVARGLMLLAILGLVGQAAADTPASPTIKGKTQKEWADELVNLRSAPIPKRVALLKQIGEMGRDINRLVPEVALYFNMIEWEVRVATAETLGKIGLPDSIPAVNALKSALTDDVWEVRRAAVRALGQLGPAAEPSTDAVIKALHDRNWSVAREAAAALGKIRPEPTIAIPALEELLQAKEWEVRTAATGSLAPLLLDNSPKGASFVEKSARNREWVVREAVADGLGSSAKPEKAVPYLMSLTKDEVWSVRIAALRSLSKIATPEVVVPELIKALSDSDWMVRKTSAGALREIGEASKDAIPVLKDAAPVLDNLYYKDPSPDVRKEAAAALKVIGPAP